MNKILIALAALIVVWLLTAGSAFADSAAIRTMAKITMSLNHFPSADDKDALQNILDSDESSEEEATIALALTNLQHRVTPADAERLEMIVDDPEADSSAQELARILIGIEHAASDEDKAALAVLAGT